MNKKEYFNVLSLLSKLTEEDKEKLITYLIALRDSEDTELPLPSCCRSKTSEAQG